MAASSGAATCILSLVYWTALQSSASSERPAQKAALEPSDRGVPDRAADGMRVKFKLHGMSSTGKVEEEGYNNLGHEHRLPWYGGGKHETKLEQGGPRGEGENP